MKRAAMKRAATLLLLVLLAIGGWWLQREGRPRIEQLGGDGDADRMPAALAAPAMATPELLEAPAQREPVARGSTARVIEDGELDAEAATGPAGPLLLHVVDDATGAELKEAFVFRPPRATIPQLNSGLDHATLEPLVVGDSPLSLPTPPGQVNRGAIAVRATGYELATLELDWSSGGERWIALRAAGGLDVTLIDPPPARTYELQLWSCADLENAVQRSLERFERRDQKAQPALLARLQWHYQEAIRRRWLIDETPPRTPTRAWGEALRTVPPTRRAAVDAAATTRVDDLASGGWLVALFFADRASADGSRLAAVAKVAIEPGRRAALELRPEPLPLLRRRRVEGLLRFDRDWLATGMPSLPRSVGVRALAMLDSGEIHGRRHPLRETSRPEEWRFEADEVAVGKALCTLPDWHFALPFDVPELASDAGDVAAFVELSVPPPVEITVRVVAAPSDRDLLAAEIDFSGASDRAALVIPPLQGRRNGERPLSWWTPAGCLQVRADRSDGRGSIQWSGEVTANESTELELVTKPHALLEVDLRDGRSLVPPTVEQLLSSGVEGKGIERGILWSVGAHDESTATLVIDGEGAALLHLEEPPGYAPIAPLEVELVRGATVRVSVALERLRR